MKYWTERISLGAVAILLVLPSLAAAQSADELAKQTQNPVASLISVPLQGNWDFGLGDRDADRHAAQHSAGHAVRRSTRAPMSSCASSCR